MPTDRRNGQHVLQKLFAWAKRAGVERRGNPHEEAFEEARERATNAAMHLNTLVMNIDKRRGDGSNRD